MPETWPATLPQAMLVDGFSESFGNGLISNDPDVGAPMTRARTRAVVRPFSCAFEATQAQLDTFRTFFNTTLIVGSLPFNMPAQTEAGTWLVKFDLEGLPSFTKVGPTLYRVSMRLMILP